MKTIAAEVVAEAPALVRGTRDKVAAAIDEADREAGVVPHYGQTVSRPDDVLYAVTEKVAAAHLAGTVELPSGVVYPKAAIARLSLTDLCDQLGDELADAVDGGLWVDAEKFAAVAPTLIRPDVVAVERLLADAGAAPVMKQAAAAPHTRPAIADIAAAAGGA